MAVTGPSCPSNLATFAWLFTSQILTTASEVPVPRIRPSG
uniref:Uncharacterized protein n=1 Tax=Rhizophora mucronata TaxID=61149 RepID=A0A2P2MLC3_RHIMU